MKVRCGSLGRKRYLLGEKDTCCDVSGMLGCREAWSRTRVGSREGTTAQHGMLAVEQHGAASQGELTREGRWLFNRGVLAASGNVSSHKANIQRVGLRNGSKTIVKDMRRQA